MKDEPDLSFPARQKAVRRPLLSRQNLILGSMQMQPPVRAEFSRFLGRTRRAVGLNGEVTVLFADNAEMQRLNRQFRGKNHRTDVLSFPSTMTNAGPQIAGDIAICVDIARENAATLGHSLESELKILILHGVLHLAGYDHERDNGEMAALENKLRAKLKLPNGLIERNLRRNQGSVDRVRSSPRTSTGRTRPRLARDSAASHGGRS